MNEDEAMSKSNSFLAKGLGITWLFTIMLLWSIDWRLGVAYIAHCTAKGLWSCVSDKVEKDDPEWLP